jgi:hypothetical protein
MRIINRLGAVIALLAAFSLHAVAGEIGTGPSAPEPPPASSSVQDASTNDTLDGEIGTGPSAMVVLIESVIQALP